MRYAIVDTESTGLPDYSKPADAPGQPRVCSIGIILTTEELGIESQTSFLVRPTGWVFDNASEAAKVNGLTYERLMDEGVPIVEAIQPYVEAIDAGRIIAGFNVIHDLKMLRAEMRHVGLEDRYLKTRYVCAMQGCRKLVDARGATGKRKAPRLEEACTFFGIEQKDKHTALDDALAAHAILQRLRERGEFPAYTDPYEKGKK